MEAVGGPARARPEKTGRRACVLIVFVVTIQDMDVECSEPKVKDAVGMRAWVGDERPGGVNRERVL